MAKSRARGTLRFRSSVSSRKGDDIEPEHTPNPDEYEWMNGRAVFLRPEGRPSNAAKRDIVLSEREKKDIEQAHRQASLARVALSDEDLQSEIEQFRQFEKTERADEPS